MAGKNRKPGLQRRDMDMAIPVVLESDDGCSRGVVRELGGGGMFVETASPSAVGSEVDVSFQSPFTGEELTMRMRVRSILSVSCGTDGESQVRGMGLSFVEDAPFANDGFPEARAGVPRLSLTAFPMN